MLNTTNSKFLYALKQALKNEGAEDLALSQTEAGQQRLSFTVAGLAGLFTFTYPPVGSRSSQNTISCAGRVARALHVKSLEQSEALEVIGKRWRAPRGSSLAKLRAEAHNALDVRWQLGTMTRKQAYAWLALKMNCKPEDCHIGMFGERECQQVLDICRGSV